MSSPLLDPRLDHTVVGKVNAISLNSSICMWEIDNFYGHCEEYILKSPKFTAQGVSGNVQWSMYLYPKGNGLGDKKYLSLFLRADATIKAVVKFKILNNERQVLIEKTMKEFVFGKSRLHGDAELVSRKLIVDPFNDVNENYTLTVVCEITVPAYEFKKIHQEEREAIEKFTDVSLVSEGKFLKVHKCILAKSSAVFAAMFDAEIREKRENTVEIADVKYDVLVEMIRFIYAGKVKNIDTLADRLAAAADKYALDGLKHMCEKSMSKNLSVDNAFKYLNFADRLGMNELKEKTIEFMSENASDITDKPEFESLSNDILRRVCRGMAKKRKL